MRYASSSSPNFNALLSPKFLEILSHTCQLIFKQCVFTFVLKKT
jgi:hypothetical protein